MLGVLSTKQEFLFPDTPLAPLPASLRVVSAQNGKTGVQIMLSCAAGSAGVSVSGDGFDAALYELLDVPVEYNTGNGKDQGGAFHLSIPSLSRLMDSSPYSLTAAVSLW